MLQPIPARILRHNVTLRVCTGVDVYQRPSFMSVNLRRVAVQPTNETRITKDNTEVTMRSIIFIDARISSPRGVDIEALKQQSEGNGHSMLATFHGKTYTVNYVDILYDDQSRYHHAEVGII